MSKSPNRFWHVMVAALVACACSDDGASTSSAPGAPSNLIAGPLGGGVHLTWSDNSEDEELFEIERKEASSGFQTIDSVPFATAVYHDANVSLGRVYAYRVRAKLPTKFTAYSNEATANLPVVGAGGSGAGTGGGQAAGSSANGGAGASGKGGSPGAAGAAGQANDGPVSFKADVVPSLVKSCGSTTTGCHNSDQAVGRIMPQFGPCKVIWYSAVDEPVGSTYISGPNQGQPTGCADLNLYDRLMGLHSMLCDAPSWDQRARYVVPGNLDKSLLYQVIAGDPSMGGVCKNEGVDVRKMPLVDPKVLPNGVELSVDAISKLRDWILQGAKNN